MVVAQVLELAVLEIPRLYLHLKEVQGGMEELEQPIPEVAAAVHLPLAQMVVGQMEEMAVLEPHHQSQVHP